PPFLPPPLTRASESDQRLNSEVLEASTFNHDAHSSRNSYRRKLWNPTAAPERSDSLLAIDILNRVIARKSLMMMGNIK
ncbi:hypothetical protein, partial [Teichococcus wenyumeiae]|uniref:hypothetical protein n=1 Tax=Teichococcus wenyumeiae TaxID=2478470 RepID=UPI001F18F327